jgi:DNA-binding MarR family transcriptional regulator
MTNRVDRLTDKGLVDRLPDPDDRRGVLVRLTRRGQSSVDAALEDLLRREQALLKDLSVAERDRLARLLRVVVGPFDAEQVDPA